MPEVRAKYERRIARFRDAMTCGRPILFLRRGETTDEVVAEMLAILRGRYPALECDVMVANAKVTGGIHIRDTPCWNSAEDWNAALSGRGTPRSCAPDPLFSAWNVKKKRRCGMWLSKLVLLLAVSANRMCAGVAYKGYKIVLQS